MLDTPLVEMMGTEAERSQAERLAKAAAATPRLRSLGEFVDRIGEGLPATQAGNLKPRDAVALAAQLGVPGHALENVRAMDDIPEVAYLFGLSVASGLLVKRGTKVVAGPVAGDLHRDPLAAWLRVAITIIEHGPLDGFRSGWRKTYVELLDANVPGLLLEIAACDGTVGLVDIQASGWEQVVEYYDYDPDDDFERAIAFRLVGALVNELTLLGVVQTRGDDVVLTDLGSLLTSIVFEEPDDLDR